MKNLKLACFLLFVNVACLSSCRNQSAEEKSENQDNYSGTYGISGDAPKRNDKEVRNEEPQKTTRNCGSSQLLVMWNDNDPTGTNIRALPSSTQGKIIATIQPSQFSEGCMFTIVEAQNGWFKIQGAIQGPNDNELYLPNGEGWIHKSVISTSTRNYGNQTIKMFDDVDGNNVVGRINQEVNLRIHDICGSWVKVEYNGVLGWVEEQWLCGIPWTTCV